MHTHVLLLLLVICTGCGRRAGESSGSVTYAGKTLPIGYITFFPAEGDGNAVGTDIVDGKFTVQLTPGKKRVLITTPPQASGGGGKKPRLVHSGIKVSADAVGNNEVHDIPAGGCTLNIDLQPPRLLRK